MLLGVSLTLIGPTLPSLAARSHIALSDAGIFTSLQFAGVILGVLIAGRLLDRVNARNVLIGGLAFAALGLLLLSVVQSLIPALVSIFVLGIGLGALDVAPNVIVAALNPDNGGVAVNILNVFFGIGAVVGPQVVNFALSRSDFTAAYRLAALGVALLIPVLLPISVAPPTIHIQQRPVIHWERLILFAALLFTYVGAEAGCGAWIFTQLTQVAQSTAATATIATSLFWGGVTVGRVLASIALRRLSNWQLLYISVGLVAIGTMLILITGHSELLSLISAFLIGLGCGPIFPTAFVLSTNLYPEARGTISGILIALGNFGAVILPWTQGQIGGGQSGGMIVILAAAVVMFLLLITVRGQYRAVSVSAV